MSATRPASRPRATSMSAMWSDPERNLADDAQPCGRPSHRRTIEVIVGDARVELFERARGFESRKRRAHAVVQAVAEAEMAIHAAVNVETLGGLELALVVIGGHPHEYHGLALGDRATVQRHVARRDARRRLHRRRVEAGHLLDGTRGESRIG